MTTCAAALFLAAVASVAQATIITDALYLLGDDDAGALAGQTAAASVDSAGSADLSGSGTYSSNTPGAASSLSMSLNGSSDGFRTADIVSNLTDNFGLELWVKMDSSSNAILAYNGNSGASGWGIILNDGAYKGMFGGVAFIGSATATSDWTHLALVRNNGTSTLYVNGASAGSAGESPNAVNGKFAIGIKPLEDGEFFGGLIDHVRVFHFNAGEFQVSDLSLNMVPEPSAIALLGTALLGLLAYAWRKRR